MDTPASGIIQEPETQDKTKSTQEPTSSLVTVKRSSLKETSRSLKAMLLIAIIAAFYIAKVILIPIFVAAFIALFASPLVRMAMHVRIPRALASFGVMIGILFVLGYLTSLLIEPALHWIKTLPRISERIVFELEHANFPLPESAKLLDESDAESIDRAMNSTVGNLTTIAAHSSLLILTQFTVVVILVYFFLTYGEDLMRNIVRAQKNFSEKKLTVVVFHAVRDDVSAYILVVSLINMGLGIATAVVLSLIGFKDPILWGALAAILNFAPYVGPLLLALLLTMIGFAYGEPLNAVLLPPGLFLVVNFIESQFVTPTVLGNRFNINPLLVILWMLMWGWLWGAIGMLLAIPILMCLKIASSHLKLFGPWEMLFSNGNGKKLRLFPKL